MTAKIFMALAFFGSFFALAQEDQSAENQNAIIIKNEAVSGAQAVTAPALVPSSARKLRDVREEQEVKTEDRILRELEKQRILDEQKRLDKLLGGAEAPDQTPYSAPAPAEKSWFFGQKSFVSIGGGFVTYPGVEDMNSTRKPAGFVSFGGYGYAGYMIFDLSFYYSTHYVKTDYGDYTDIRRVAYQPAFSMAVKLSPWPGKLKPYIGLIGALAYRSWGFIHRTGEPVYNEHPELEDVADKDWFQAFDAGAVAGADVILGKSLGVNVDMRYLMNLYTENRETARERLAGWDLLDKRDSLILSANLKYYF